MKPVEERIAAAICWLARQNGLPEVAQLRYAVIERHGLGCDWCDWPLAELLEIAKVPDGDPSARAFEKYPSHQQRQMVAKALGTAA